MAKPFGVQDFSVNREAPWLAKLREQVFGHKKGDEGYAEEQVCIRRSLAKRFLN